MAEVIITKTRTKTIEPNMSQTIKVVTEKQVAPAAPVQGKDINLANYGLLFCLCAVVAWGSVEICKEYFKARLKLKGKPKPWYYLTFIRALSCVVGGLSGWFISDSFGMGARFAILTGCAAGAMAAFVVRLIKTKLKRVAEK